MISKTFRICSLCRMRPSFLADLQSRFGWICNPPGDESPCYSLRPMNVTGKQAQFIGANN